MRATLGAWALLAACAAGAAGGETVRFELKKHPTLRLGDVLRVDFRARIQSDVRSFSPAVETGEGSFEFSRARVGIQGRVFRDFEFEIERELRPADSPWCDLYVNLRRYKRFEVQAGRFKIPFSLDQLTPAMNMDFIFRSRVGDRLAAARDTGVMLHGRLAGRVLSYQAGVFRHDGDNARAKDNRPTGGPTIAARLVGRPPKGSVPRWLRDFDFGGAFTHSQVAEGQSGLRTRMISKSTLFPRLFVSGRRLRLGAELNWNPGPVALRAEYIRAGEQRLTQGMRYEDLPELVSRGWYVSAVRPLIGGRRSKSAEGQRLEAAVRYEQVRSGSWGPESPPSRSPRAAHVLGNGGRLWTAGLNWYPHRFLKLQFNSIRETIEDIQRSPAPGHGVFWSQICRIQFSL